MVKDEIDVLERALLAALPRVDKIFLINHASKDGTWELIVQNSAIGRKWKSTARSPMNLPTGYDRAPIINFVNRRRMAIGGAGWTLINFILMIRANFSPRSASNTILFNVPVFNIISPRKMLRNISSFRNVIVKVRRSMHLNFSSVTVPRRGSLSIDTASGKKIVYGRPASSPTSSGLILYG